MIDAEYQEFIAGVKSGSMLIGVDLSMARKLYTSVPLSHIAKKTGEFPYFEKAVVLGAFVGGPLALLAGFVFAVLAFGWWAVSAIPVSTVIYFVFQGSSSMPKQGMGGVTVVLALAILALCLHWFPSMHACRAHARWCGLA